MALSPDGSQVAAGAEDGTTRVWSMPSNAPPIVLGKLPHEVMSVGLSRDGQRVVSATHPEVRMWSARDAKPIATFGQQQGTQALDFSPDGRLLVTGSALGPVRVWDAETLTLRGEWHATFSPDGKRAVIASRNVARVWPVFQSPQDLVDRARRLKPRPLSAAQRQRYFLDSRSASVPASAPGAAVPSQ